jgi:hypothetical protein
MVRSMTRMKFGSTLGTNVGLTISHDFYYPFYYANLQFSAKIWICEVHEINRSFASRTVVSLLHSDVGTNKPEPLLSVQCFSLVWLP